MNTNKRKIAVAITGASGALYAKTFLDELAEHRHIEVLLVMTDNAKMVWQHELGNTDFEKYPFRFFDNNDYMSPLASGSAKWDALIIIPCSAGTMGRIANGISNNLITRAADVCLKERRQLILTLRETPYNLIHIENMKKITMAGGIILPATPSFYSMPKNFTELAKTVTNRIFSLINIENNGFQWGDNTK